MLTFSWVVVNRTNCRAASGDELYYVPWRNRCGSCIFVSKVIKLANGIRPILRQDQTIMPSSSGTSPFLSLSASSSSLLFRTSLDSYRRGGGSLCTRALHRSVEMLKFVWRYCASDATSAATSSAEAKAAQEVVMIAHRHIQLPHRRFDLQQGEVVGSRFKLSEQVVVRRDSARYVSLAPMASSIMHTLLPRY